MFELIRIYYTSIKRSPQFDAKITGKILSMIGFAYLIANLVFIGFFLDRIFASIKPANAPFDTFCSIFLFIWVIDIFVKFIYKSNKHVDIQPYLTLPIKLNRIFSLLFFKELLSKWNFIWVVILTPFLFKTFYLSNGLSSTLLSIVIVYFTSVIISFALRFIEITTFQKSFLYYPIPLLFSICLGYLAFRIAAAPNLSFNVNLHFFNYKIWICIVMLLLFIFLYFIFIKYCKYEIYSLFSGKNKSVFISKFNWLDQLGIKGEIIKLCFKEINRSQLKRNIFTSILFLFYLFFFKEDAPFIGRFLLSVIPFLMIVGIFGEFTYVAESMFFDKLMTISKDTPFLILIYKYFICIFILSIFTVLSIILTLNKTSILFWIANFFFAGGIMAFFLFQNAVYNKHRIDMLGSLRKRSNFNFHSFVVVGCIVVIFAFVFILTFLTTESTALYVILTSGAIFTLASPLWLKNIYERFLKRKYHNMNGFRNV